MLKLLQSCLAGATRIWTLGVFAVSLLALIACGSGAPEPDDSGQASSDSDTIKVGVLHSLSGTMSISETAVKDATLMDIEEINASGGVMGRQIQVVVEDGASDFLP